MDGLCSGAALCKAFKDVSFLTHLFLLNPAKGCVHHVETSQLVYSLISGE